MRARVCVCVCGRVCVQVYNEHAGSYTWKRLPNRSEMKQAGGGRDMVLLSMQHTLEVSVCVRVCVWGGVCV